MKYIRQLIISFIILATILLIIESAKGEFTKNIKIDTSGNSTTRQHLPCLAINEKEGIYYAIWHDSREPKGLYFSKSENGKNWAKEVLLAQFEYYYFLRPLIIVDNIGNPIIFYEKNNSIFCLSSDDKGVTFNKPVRVDNTDTKDYLGSALTGNNGTIYLVWSDANNTSYNDDNDLSFSKSTDYGRTWIPPKNITKGYAPCMEIDEDENLYIAYSSSYKNESGWRNILVNFTYSLDEGESFSEPVRIDNDTTNKSKKEEVSLTIDSKKNLYVVWLDCRNDEENDEPELFFVKSTNGGQNWINDTNLGQAERYLKMLVNKNDKLLIFFWKSSLLNILLYSVEGEILETHTHINGEYSPVLDENNTLYLLKKTMIDELDGIYFSYSDNNGKTFKNHTKIESSKKRISYQKDPAIVVDNIGDVYAIFYDDRIQDNNIRLTKSSDYGQSFGGDNIFPYYSQEYSIYADDNNVSIVYHYYDYENDKSYLYHINSVDKGENFSEKKVVYNPTDNFEVDNINIKQYKDNIYISWKMTSDVFFAKSIGGGDFEILCINNETENTQSPIGMAVDNNGTIYILWSDNTAYPNRYINLSISKDNGETFETNTIETSDYYYSDITTNDEGIIYIICKDSNSDISKIYLLKSEDGGKSFSEKKRVDDQESIKHTITIKAFKNMVYAVWYDYRNDNYDIYFAESNDYGENFQTNEKVNDDKTQAKQESPTTAIDDNGYLFIAWEDRRRKPTSNSAIDIFFTTTKVPPDFIPPEDVVNEPELKALKEGEIEVKWSLTKPESEDVDHYDIYRKENEKITKKEIDNKTGLLDTVPKDLRKYTDTTSEDNQTYYYAVVAVDRAGNYNSSNAGISIKGVKADAIPPKIENIQVEKITGNSSVIKWTTHEESDSLIIYGLNDEYGESKSNTSYVKSHSIELKGLKADKVYHFCVNSTDNVGNSNETKDYSFKTLDTIPPEISKITIESITGNSVIINWTTDEESDSLVKYGKTTDYNLSKSENEITKIHHIKLTDLNPDILYHFSVNSTDCKGNSKESEDFTFKTLDTIPPKINNVSYRNLTENSAIIIWETDELSNSLVKYGLNKTYGFEKLDIEIVTLHSIILTDLMSNTTYYFCAVSNDENENSNQSKDYTFTTKQKPNHKPTVTLSSPTNGSTVTKNSPTLSWSSEDKDLGDELSYNVYLDTSSEPTKIVSEKQLETTYQATNLENGKTYYWKVIPNDGKEDGICKSGVWHFTINLPDTPDTVQPTISHEPVKNATEGIEIEIKAEVTDNIKVKNASLFYRKVGDAEYQEIEMKAKENNFSATIPANIVTALGIEYYIFATDGVNNATSPKENVETKPYNISVESTKVGLPDLTINNEDITFSNENPKEGEIIVINATVHNVGEEKAENVVVGFYCDNDLIKNVTINSIAINGIETVKIEWNAVKGEHKIWVKVDLGNEITEINEENNEDYNEIRVGLKENDEFPIFFILIPVVIVVVIIIGFVINQKFREG